MAFLILHGIENHRPPAHWQFWLAARLAEHGHDVLYPSLPRPDAPSYEDWLATLPRDPHTVICHSLACLLWLKSAPALTAERLLLVSPPASDRVPEAGASFRLQRFDPQAVRDSVRGEIRIVCSDADPYNPAGAQSMYATPLGLEADVIPGAGHITPADGYGPWPYAEEWCLTTAPWNGSTSGAR
jgi:serine hydrolase